MKPILEAKSKTIVLAWGRMNPPTIGHGVLVKAVEVLSKKYSADHVIYLTKTQDPKKNPLNVNQKVKFARMAFKGVNIQPATDSIRTIMEAARALNTKYSKLIVVAGSDRVLEYKTLLDKYNGKDYNFDSILVVSAGERDPDADGTAGMSASKMRKAAEDNNFTAFLSGVPKTISNASAKMMFNDLRAAMNIIEGTEAREEYVKNELFCIGDIVTHGILERTVTFRGSNYVILDNQEKVWLKDIIPTEKVNEAVVVKQQEKIRAARIIAMALGFEEAETKTDPVMIVNSALRLSKRKVLNKEAKDILRRMLDLARKMEISFDENLAKSLTEGEVPELDLPKEDETHHLMHLSTLPSDKSKRYARIRKIHYKAHESIEDEELDSIVLEVTDDFISDEAYDDDDFVILDENDQEVEVENFEGLNEVLSRIARMRAKVKMARTKAKRERGARIALSRRSDGKVASKRARRLAIQALKKRLAKKDLSKLTVSEKEKLEKRLERMKPVIARLAVKMLPKVRQFEKDRLSKD